MSALLFNTIHTRTQNKPPTMAARTVADSLTTDDLLGLSRLLGAYADRKRGIPVRGLIEFAKPDRPTFYAVVHVNEQTPGAVPRLFVLREDQNQIALFASPENVDRNLPIIQQLAQVRTLGVLRTSTRRERMAVLNVLREIGSQNVRSPVSSAYGQIPPGTQRPRYAAPAPPSDYQALPRELLDRLEREAQAQKLVSQPYGSLPATRKAAAMMEHAWRW